MVYRKLLRSLGVLLAVLLVFDSGVLIPSTKTLSSNTQLYMANSVGIMAAVEPNEYNTITAALTAQKTDLDKRERALTERELEIGLKGSAEQSGDFSVFLLSIALFIVATLMVMNFAFDILRARKFDQLLVRSA